MSVTDGESRQPAGQPSVPPGQPAGQPSVPPGQPAGQPSVPPGQPAGKHDAPSGLVAQNYLWPVLIIDGLIAVGAPFFDVWYVRYVFHPSAPDIPLQAGAALIAVVTFVGVWLIQRLRPNVGPVSEMRDAIAAAVVVVYLVILGWSSFFPTISKSSGETLNPLTSTFITNFTALTGIVIGFYFTSTAATQIAARRSKATNQDDVVAPDETGVS